MAYGTDPISAMLDWLENPPAPPKRPRRPLAARAANYALLSLAGVTALAVTVLPWLVGVYTMFRWLDPLWDYIDNF